jgi:putative ABC transport system ATP-binding protein
MNASEQLSTKVTGPVVVAHELSQRVPTVDGELCILDRVNLSIPAGQTVAIVGASGSGKSTLLGLLAGLDRPSDGDVQLAGQSLNALDEDQRARVRADHVGFVFQNFQLLPALTALENVMLPLEIAGLGDARTRAEHWLQRVGLGQRFSHPPQKLSGGEQQRVAIARAFACAPSVLFADEPTGNLDTATGQRIIDLLFEINAQQGTTLVLVTHDEKLASRCARRVTLAAGQLITDELTDVSV